MFKKFQIITIIYDEFYMSHRKKSFNKINQAISFVRLTLPSKQPKWQQDGEELAWKKWRGSLPRKVEIRLRKFMSKNKRILNYERSPRDMVHPQDSFKLQDVTYSWDYADLDPYHHDIH